MDAELRASAWGWSSVVSRVLRGLNPEYSRQYGWRSFRLRHQAILGEFRATDWDQAVRHEPVLHALLSGQTGPESHSVCLSRLTTGSPGLRADAACDLARLSYERTDPEAALSWIAHALTTLPTHQEALRWQRLLLAPPSESLPSSPAQIDLRALTPVSKNAWLSPERWRRRGISGRWTRPANPKSALFVLQERGVHTRLLAPESWWATQSHTHPGVELETGLDTVASLWRSKRPAAASAWLTWRLASSLSPAWVERLACIFARTCHFDPSLSQLGLLASGVACRMHPQSELWRATRARYLAENGQPERAVREARASLRRSPSAETKRLSIETLDRCGYLREAARAREAVPPPLPQMLIPPSTSIQRPVKKSHSKMNLTAI
jgi:hypothetical protein